VGRGGGGGGGGGGGRVNEQVGEGGGADKENREGGGNTAKHVAFMLQREDLQKVGPYMIITYIFAYCTCLHIRNETICTHNACNIC
jgi:hypothetical protein